MIQLTDQQYGDIMDSLGAARQILMPVYGQPPALHVLARARHLLTRVDEMLKGGTIVREDGNG